MEKGASVRKALSHMDVKDLESWIEEPSKDVPIPGTPKENLMTPREKTP